MLILGVNAYHPDASVVLLKDGELIWAAEEERYNRVKHSSGFPSLALKQCLSDTGYKPLDIDYVAISKDPRANLAAKIIFILKNKPNWELLADRFKALRRAASLHQDYQSALNLKPNISKTKFVYVEHHLSHAASSFFASGFDEAAFLTIDGMGDFASATWGSAKGSDIRMMGKVNYPHSVGFLYTAATQFLGFIYFGDEFKVMGLAAYGNPVFTEQFRKIISLKPNGKFELNLEYFTHHKGKSKVNWKEGAPTQEILFSGKWNDLFGAPRLPKSEITQRDKDIAASLQVVLEEIYFHVLNHLHGLCETDKLCLAGGVAFNGVANGKITKNTPFKQVYIQPAAGDSGTALGAALYVSRKLVLPSKKFHMIHASYGSAFSDKEIMAAAGEHQIPYQKMEKSILLKQLSQDLADGAVVGWFQGAMEFGPRALGNRSILADPRRSDMKDILNQRIKRRETFRPFAPAVKEENAHDYFEMDCDRSPFMLKVFNVKENKRELIPAITHADGTARVQTVSKVEQPIFWELLDEFEKITKIPMLLNTSFNENEPIVCLPKEAIDCFLKTKMDVLVINQYYFKK